MATTGCKNRFGAACLLIQRGPVAGDLKPCNTSDRLQVLLVTWISDDRLGVDSDAGPPSALSGHAGAAAASTG